MVIDKEKIDDLRKYYSVTFDPRGIFHVKGEFDCWVEGVTLVETSSEGKSLPRVDEITVHYEDDEWKSVEISGWYKADRLGRPHSGLDFYLSSWHGPAPLPEELEFTGEPGEFVVTKYWNTQNCREDISLDVWVAGNRPKED